MKEARRRVKMEFALLSTMAILEESLERNQIWRGEIRSTMEKPVLDCYVKAVD